MFAAQALCQWRAPESVPLLRDGLKKSLLMPDPRWAPSSLIFFFSDGPIKALGCLGALAKDAVPELVEAAQSKDEELAARAKVALKSIGTKEALEGALPRKDQR